MSVIVKGMDMPKSCGKCFVGNREICVNGCPLVPVPPHGRLIEESKVLDIVSEWCPDDDGSVGKYGDLREMLDEIEAIPTIIPADDKDINVPNKEDGE